jgi:hypothetical protein
VENSRGVVTQENWKEKLMIDSSQDPPDLCTDQARQVVSKGPGPSWC